MYLASGGHGAFKPQDEREEDALLKMQKNIPEKLQKFLQKYGDMIRSAKKGSSEEQSPEKELTITLKTEFPVIPSPLADAIVAGTAEIIGQVLDANRFALTRDNYAHIGTTFTPAEVEDTTRLVNELTRRLRILLQLKSEDRKKVLGGLGMSLNSLQAALVAMKETTPDAMIRRLNQALSGHDQEGGKEP